jgi:hypothetical protein
MTDPKKTAVAQGLKKAIVPAGKTPEAPPKQTTTKTKTAKSTGAKKNATTKATKPKAKAKPVVASKPETPVPAKPTEADKRKPGTPAPGKARGNYYIDKTVVDALKAYSDKQGRGVSDSYIAEQALREFLVAKGALKAKGGS